MSKIISAIFDDTDTAECAMVSLKRSGFSVESYEVAPMMGNIEDDDFNPLVFSFGGDLGASTGMTSSGMFPIQPFSSVLYAFEDNRGDRRNSDVQSTSVRMKITVPNEEVKNVESMLRSCHGYRLRTM